MSIRPGHAQILTALFITVSAVLPAQDTAVTSYPAVAPGSGGPNAIAPGPDGALWFTLASGNIGRMTSAGTFTSYPIPTAASAPMGIAAGPDGAMWFTESAANQIGRITTAGVVTEYPVLTANSSPWGIASGPDGNLWFTEYNADNIGSITTSGIVTEYRNVYGANPAGITTGPDGALWFTEYIQVGRVTTGGSFSSWSVTATSNSPQGIASGSDGALWFTEAGANSIGRITTGGDTSIYPTFDMDPLAIAAGSNATLWFTDSYNSDVGSITTAGSVAYYPAPPPLFGTPGTTGISQGPDGSLWFTENGAGVIGQVVFATAGLSVNRSGGHPGPGAAGTSLAFSGTGYAPNEAVSVYTDGIGSPVLTRAKADSSGSFNQETLSDEPPLPFGYRLFLSRGATSGKIGTAQFEVTPRVLYNPSYGPPDSITEAQGYGFAPFDTVDFYWQSPVTYLGSTIVDSQGSFSGIMLQVPKEGFGDYQIAADGTNVPAASDTAWFGIR